MWHYTLEGGCCDVAFHPFLYDRPELHVASGTLCGTGGQNRNWRLWKTEIYAARSSGIGRSRQDLAMCTLEGGCCDVAFHRFLYLLKKLHVASGPLCGAGGRKRFWRLWKTETDAATRSGIGRPREDLPICTLEGGGCSGRFLFRVSYSIGPVTG